MRFSWVRFDSTEPAFYDCNVTVKCGSHVLTITLPDAGYAGELFDRIKKFVESVRTAR